MTSSFTPDSYEISLLPIISSRNSLTRPQEKLFSTLPRIHSDLSEKSRRHQNEASESDLDYPLSIRSPSYSKLDQRTKSSIEQQFERQLVSFKHLLFSYIVFFKILLLLKTLLQNPKQKKADSPAIPHILQKLHTRLSTKAFAVIAIAE